MSVYVCEGFLSPEECVQALSYFPGAEYAAINNARGESVYKPLRRGRASFAMSAEGLPLAKKMRELLFDVNSRVFNVDISGVEPLQLAEYGVGEGYGQHLDIGPGGARLRKLSLSVQLSDPTTYDGGDLVLWGSPTAPRTQGTAIIFESCLVHEVTPVTRGMRHSLVAWANGIRPYR